MRWRRHTLCLGLVLGASGVAVACSSETSGPELQAVTSVPGELYVAEIGGHDVLVDHTGGQISLPFDRYLLILGPSYLNIVDSAQDLLAEECMSRRGIALEFPSRPARSDWSTHTRRYGIFDSEAAHSHGYQWPQSRAVAELVEFQQQIEPEIAEGLLGSSQMGQSGCLGEASSELRMSSAFGLQAFVNGQNSAAATLQASIGDERVQSALADWRSCMGSHLVGPPPDTPMDLSARFASEDSLPVEGEVALAIADVDCKREVELIEVWVGVEAELQLDIIRANQPALDELRAESILLIRRAAELVSTDVPTSPMWPD